MILENENLEFEEEDYVDFMPSNRNNREALKAATSNHRQQVEEKDKLHITHFFSSYSAMDENDRNIVQRSWYEAAQFAKERGILVEHLDFTLPDDTKGSPSFAKRYNLTLWLNHHVKGRVGTVGEPYHLASRIGKGRIFIATNTDIGMLPDTYEKIWKWATKNYLTQEAQFEAMNTAASYLEYCFTTKLPPENHYLTCAEDAKIIYMHSGGFLELWSDIAFDVGVMGLTKPQVRFRSLPIERIWGILLGFSREKTRELFELPKNPNIIDIIRNYSPKAPSIEDINQKVPVPQYFAGTITRLDFVSDPLPTDLSSVVKQINHKGQKHPGNDCFVFDPRFIPKAIENMGHPPGFRPFGLWIAVAFFDAGINFRRISGTREDPWTFHIGKGEWGFNTIPWIERASEDPPYPLFLAGNFDHHSEGAFRRMFHGPRVCQNTTRPWRMIQYCNSIPDEYCIGVMRYGCAYQQSLELRDNIWYQRACESIFTKQLGQARRPLCNICNFFFRLRQVKARFSCKPGKMRYCDGLGEEVCPYP